MYGDYQDTCTREKHPSEYTIQDVINQIDIEAKDVHNGHGKLKYNIDGYIIEFDFNLNEDEGGFEVHNLICKRGKYDAFVDLTSMEDALIEKLWLAWHKTDVFEVISKTFKQ